MVFSSAVFLFVFLPITAFVYYFSAAQVKNYVLLIASLFFYAWGEPQYILLMLLSILINYVFGLIIEGIRGRKKDKLCSLLMCLAVVFNLALLGYYKYAGFLYENLNRVLPLNLDIPQVPLPIGISFYTFQILSYVIDVYRGNVPAQRNVLNLGLYISFFPQLIAGPIVRYIDIEAQIKSRQLSMDKVYEGLRCFTAGFAKKILLADQLAPLADAMFNASDISAPSAWVGAIAYTFQIYFDFSGYSDMAIGLGKIFGFEFAQNFNYPYISRSIQEFWRRWHISLSTWFKDYVYIPLGGSRNGTWRTYRNLIIVFFFTGLWHGASWNFIVWGLYYVLFLIFERMGGHAILDRLPRFLQHIYSLLIIIVGWVFFRAQDLESALHYLVSMFTASDGAWTDLYIHLNPQLVFCLVAATIFSLPVGRVLVQRLRRNTQIIYDGFLVIVFLIAISYMLGSGFSPFLYFRF